MKIYTRGGDKGRTSLVSGERVFKNNPRVEAYGTTDELSAHIGYLHDLINDENNPTAQELKWILHRLMNCSALLSSTDPMGQKLPRITPEDIATLENWIDQNYEGLPVLSAFTLPCGGALVSYSHICRTVCRRAERTIINLKLYLESENPEQIATTHENFEQVATMDENVKQVATMDENVEKFVNRLSDYLYSLARKFANQGNGREILWNV